MVLEHRSLGGPAASEAGLLTSQAATHASSSSMPAASPDEHAHELFADVLYQSTHGVRAWVHEVMTESGELDTAPFWGLGVGLMIIGTIASSVGLLCFKRAGSLEGLPWYRNQWFWGGLLLFVMTAAVLDTVVFAVTPLGLIAPFAGLTIVVSFALASLGCCGVKEPPTKTATAAVVLIVCGVTICAVFGPKSDGNIDPIGLQKQFESHIFLYVICAAAGPLFLTFYAVSVFKPAEVRKALRSWIGALALALGAAFCGAVTQLQFKALASALMTILGAMTDAGGGRDKIQGLYPSAGVCATQLLCVASTGVAQIGFLNFAISGAPVAYTVPAYQVRASARGNSARASPEFSPSPSRALPLQHSLRTDPRPLAALPASPFAVGAARLHPRRLGFRARRVLARAGAQPDRLLGRRVRHRPRHAPQRLGAEPRDESRAGGRALGRWRRG